MLWTYCVILGIRDQVDFCSCSLLASLVNPVEFDTQGLRSTSFFVFFFFFMDYGGLFFSLFFWISLRARIFALSRLRGKLSFNDGLAQTNFIAFLILPI